MDTTLFDARPGHSAVVLADSPKFTIVAVSNDFVSITGIKRNDLIGKGLFEMFPQSPSDTDFSGDRNISASFDRVLKNKKPDQLQQQRYDLPNGDGSFTEKYWKALNVPVLDENGEVNYIIHTAEDVTDITRASQRESQLDNIERAFGLFIQAPVAVCIVEGSQYNVELANDQMLQLLGRTSAMIGKPIEESLTEANIQGLTAILEKVRLTGDSFHSPSFPAVLLINGVREQRYFDLVFQPYFQHANDKEASRIFCVAYNVTQQVQTQKKLEEVQKETERQKRLYETINSSTPDLIYVFDLEYRFTYANKALLNMWGSTWEQSIGKRLLENGYEPWHAKMHEDEIDHVVATKQAVRGEVSFPHATLGRRVYDYILVPVINNNGEVEAVAGTTRDITEIKRASQTIEESEERFRNLADESPMFVFIIEPDPMATVSYWNKTWLDYTGQQPKEAIGRAWDGIIHPDDLPVVMEHYAPAFQNKQPYFIPSVRVKRHDGQYRWHAFKGNPRYLSKGEFNGFVGVGFDIHEQKIAEEAFKQSEARTRLAVESAHLGTFEIDVDEQTMISSARTAEIFGLDSTKPRPYNAFINSIHPEDLVFRNNAHEEARHTGELFYEARIVWPDESLHWIRLNGRYLLDSSRPHILVGTVMDITEEKKAADLLEQKIEERTRELKLVNDQLKQFTYSASHDLQEPLRKISYFIDMLMLNLSPALNEQNKKITERIQHTIGRMRALIDDLLTYSNTTLGVTGFQEVVLADIVKDVLDDMEATLIEKEADVKFRELPTVKGDQRQLRQLLQNLISNALKYHKKEQAPEVIISARTVDGKAVEANIPTEFRKNKYHLIEVRDNGIGFDPDDADRIFRLFQRLHGKAEYEGTGVGLAIAQKVVENHHGYIWAEGEPGAGASFKILLPE